MNAFLQSERIALRPIQRADIPALMALMSDREIGLLSGEVHPMTEKGFEDFYERCQKTEDRIWFLIVDKQTEKIIGETGFLRVFMLWRTSDFSLVI